MLGTYYKKAVLIPCGIVFLCNLAYFIIDALFSTYKSEWLTTEAFFPWMLAMGLANSVIISLLSLTIFLNRYLLVKNTGILRILCWFFCPIGWIAIILFNTGSDLINFKDGVDSTAIFAIINTIPYTIGLAWSYAQFRHNAKSSLIATNNVV